jgi:Holliday junction resolvase-like predicted endonuclease
LIGGYDPRPDEVQYGEELILRLRELVANNDLAARGYEVFRNCSSHGLVDIIGRKDGLISLFDVKARDPKLGFQRYRNGAQSLSAEQLAEGVQLLLVDGRDGACIITA